MGIPASPYGPTPPAGCIGEDCDSITLQMRTPRHRGEGACPKSRSWRVAGVGTAAASGRLFQPYPMGTRSQTCPWSNPPGGRLMAELSGVLNRVPDRIAVKATQYTIVPGAEKGHAQTPPGYSDPFPCTSRVLSTAAATPAPAPAHPRSPNNPPGGKCLKSLIFRSPSALLLGPGGDG